MQDGTLLLGPILLQDFEVPDSIRWGGAQRLVIHRLPGGARVIDALGRDDAEIAWSGVCSPGRTPPPARACSTRMRAGGGVWPLTWEAFFYSVVIASFRPTTPSRTGSPIRSPAPSCRTKPPLSSTRSSPSPPAP